MFEVKWIVDRDLEERHKAQQEQDYQVDHYERKAPRIEIPHKFLSSGGSIMYVYMERVKNSSDVSFALRQVDKPVSNYGAFNELEKSKECGVYINPFRVVDLSVIPSHILQELESYPILTQIAILSNPEIRKKYFPYWKQ